MKGYQYAKGKYVVVDEKDFEKARPPKSRSIDILQFAKSDEIDSTYFEKPYYIIPSKGGEKSYHLLIKALEETESVGIAEFMLRNREHVCTIKPYNDVLILNQIRYQEEIKEAPVVAKSTKAATQELELAKKTDN